MLSFDIKVLLQSAQNLGCLGKMSKIITLGPIHSDSKVLTAKLGRRNSTEFNSQIAFKQITK